MIQEPNIATKFESWQETVWGPTTSGDPRPEAVAAAKRGRFAAGAFPDTGSSSTMVGSKSIMDKALLRDLLLLRTCAGNKLG